MILAGIFGDSSGVGFGGLLMLAGAFIALFGLYAENSTGMEDSRMPDSSFVYLPRARGESGVQSTFYFGRVLLGLTLFITGILVGVIGLTVTQLFVTLIVLIVANILYGIRRRTMYQDAMMSDVRSVERLSLDSQASDKVDLVEDEDNNVQSSSINM